MRTRGAVRVSRPNAANAACRLRPAIAAVLRRTRRLRPALSTCQTTTGTTRAVIPRAATAARNQHTRRHTRAETPRTTDRPNIRRTTTTRTRPIPLPTTIPTTRRRRTRATNVEIQRRTRRDRERALHATAETTRNRIRRIDTGRANGIDEQVVEAARHDKGLRRTGAVVAADDGGGRRCRRHLAGLRRLLPSRVDDAHAVVVGRPEGQASVAILGRRDRQRGDDRRRVGRGAAVDLVGDGVEDGRRLPVDRVVTLPTCRAHAGHVRRGRHDQAQSTVAGGAHIPLRVRDVVRARRRVGGAAAGAVMRATAATPVPATSATAVKRRVTAATHRLRTCRTGVRARPKTTRATRSLRSAESAVLRRTRRLRRALTTRQAAARTAHAVVASASATAGHEHAIRHRRATYTDVRRATTARAQPIPLPTTIPTTRRRRTCAAHVQIQRRTRRDRNDALDAPAETTGHRIRRVDAGRADGIDLHRRHTGRHRVRLCRVRTAEIRDRLEGGCGLGLGRLRRLVARVVDHADAVVVGGAEREARVSERGEPDRHGADDGSGIRRGTAIHLVVRGARDRRGIPSDDVVALPARGHDAGDERRGRVRQSEVAARIRGHVEGATHRQRVRRAGRGQRERGVGRGGVLDRPAIERQRRRAGDVDPRRRVVVANHVREDQRGGTRTAAVGRVCLTRADLELEQRRAGDGHRLGEVDADPELGAGSQDA